MTRLLSFTRRPLAIISLLACLIGGLGLAAGGGPAVAAPNPVHPGLGRHGGGEFIGYYLTRDGTKVYCLIPRKGTPASVSLRTVHRYPGLSAPSSDALSYALTTWGDARSRDAAAVESQVVNTLAGNGRDVARRNRALPATLRRLVTAHVAQARSMHGPYRLSVSTTKAVLPGGSAAGSVRLTSAVGHAVAGMRVNVRSSANARVPSVVRTDSRGQASFRYSVVDIGEVHVTASTSGLPGTAMRITDPRPGEQRLAAPSARVGVRAAASFRATPGGFSHSYACSSECAGRPVVTLRACAAASRVVSAIVYRFASRAVVVGFPASGRVGCRSVKVTVPDRAAVSASWQFRTSHGWSGAVAAGGTFVVDCPAAALLTVRMGYDCTRASVTVGLVAAARPAVLIVSGARSARVTAAAGKSATWTVSVPCGAREKLTMRSAVLRAGGGWNYGRSASVITP